MSIDLEFGYRRGDRDINNLSPEIDIHRCSLQITNYLQDSTSTNLSRSLQSEKRVMFSFLGYSPKRKLILHGMYTSYRSYVMNRATTLTIYRETSLYLIETEGQYVSLHSQSQKYGQLDFQEGMCVSGNRKLDHSPRSPVALGPLQQG